MHFLALETAQLRTDLRRHSFPKILCLDPLLMHHLKMTTVLIHETYLCESRICIYINSTVITFPRQAPSPKIDGRRCRRLNASEYRLRCTGALALAGGASSYKLWLLLTTVSLR